MTQEKEEHKKRKKKSCRSQLFYFVFQRADIGADNAVGKRLAVLEEDKGRHGGDAQFGSDLRELVNVDLEEAHGRVGLAELADPRSDVPAGRAPGGEEVDHHWT